MPTLWRTAGGLVYANSGETDPFTATLSQLEDCCCSPSPSFPQYYCIKYWLGLTCETLSCISAYCMEVPSQAVYDAFQFGVCTDHPLIGKEMHTTDDVPHANFTACYKAGCSY